MHMRIHSDIRLDKFKLDILPINSSKILKSEQDSTQPSQTYIFQGNLPENKTGRALSPVIKSSRKRQRLKPCQSLAIENDPDGEEYSIWGDESEIPIGNELGNNIIQFLELMKYRYERTTKKPISCYNVIQMTKKYEIIDMKVNLSTQFDKTKILLYQQNTMDRFSRLEQTGWSQSFLMLLNLCQLVLVILIQNYGEFLRIKWKNCIILHQIQINNDIALQPKLLAQHRFADIGVYLDIGDIKNEEVDVIVAQTDMSFKLPYYLTNNVSLQTKAQLLKDIQLIRDKQAFSHGDVFHSHAAELEFDFLFYCVLPNEDDEPLKLAKNPSNSHLSLKLPKNAHQKYQKQFIYDCMMRCLKIAEEMEITSICFPVLKSTKFTIATIATMQIIAVKNFLEENVSKIKFLSQIRFCIQDEKDQELFRWAFDKVFMDTDDSSEASDDDSLNNNSGNSGGGSAGNSLSKNYELQPTVKKLQKNFEEDEFVKSFGVNYYGKFDSPQSLERKLSI